MPVGGGVALGPVERSGTNLRRLPGLLRAAHARVLRRAVVVGLLEWEADGAVGSVAVLPVRDDLT